MNLLKYATVWCVALMAFGLLSTAPAAAQASGQSKQVVPRNLKPLPDIDSLMQTNPELFLTEQDNRKDDTAADTLFWEPRPEQGIGPTEAVEKLLEEEKYEQAVRDFEYFCDTVQGELCYLLYAYVLFYDRMMHLDGAQAAEYQAKHDIRLAQMEKKCPKFLEFLTLKAARAEEPQEVVKWMTKAIAVSPKPGFYLMRANALWTMEQTKKACADYKKAADKRHPEGVSLYTERCANL